MEEQERHQESRLPRESLSIGNRSHTQAGHHPSSHRWACQNLSERVRKPLFWENKNAQIWRTFVPCIDDLDDIDHLRVEARGHFNTHTGWEERQVQKPQVGLLVPWGFVFPHYAGDGLLGENLPLGLVKNARHAEVLGRRTLGSTRMLTTPRGSRNCRSRDFQLELGKLGFWGRFILDGDASCHGLLSPACIDHYKYFGCKKTIRALC